MTRRDLFSQRGKTPPTELTYDLPRTVRAQIETLWTQYLTPKPASLFDDRYWPEVQLKIMKAHGVTRSEFGEAPSAFGRCLLFLRMHQNTERVLDLIEVVCTNVVGNWRGLLTSAIGRSVSAAIIEETNDFFAAGGVGYRYLAEERMLVRVDDTYAHAAIVKPALELLLDEQFKGPQHEYATAHDHMRHGRYEDALTWASKAAESTLKTICEANGKHRTTTHEAALSELIRLEIVPSYLKNLALGIYNLRHNEGGHGSGSEIRNVKKHQAAFALHSAAAVILFAIESHKANPTKP